MTQPELRFTVQPPEAGQRLDSWLASKLEVSRNKVSKVLKSEDFLVNGRPEKVSYVLAEGDVVVGSQSLAQGSSREVEAPFEQSASESASTTTVTTQILPGSTSEPVPLVEVLYEDEDVVVINKPAGLLVHAGNGYAGEPTVAAYARTISSDPDPERPGIVHRLDRDTSGLLVIAKNAAAKAALQGQWKKRSVLKQYDLLVSGRPKLDEAIIDLPLDRDPATPTRRAVVVGGRPAKTRYRLVQAYPGYSLLAAWPETGRTHQLRVHLASIGHPIVGDTTYGQDDKNIQLDRQFLHAGRLKLQLPSGSWLDLSAPLPTELKGVLERLSTSL